MTEYSNTYLLIGEFVSKVNTLELAVNTSLEKIIGSYPYKFPKKNTEDLIDFTQEQSVTKRINFLATLLAITKPNETEEIISDLFKFLKDYNKKIRKYRDFIAHNPMINAQNGTIIISSRRYKGNLNSLEVVELRDLIPVVTEMVHETFDISARISQLYPYVVVRQITKKE